MSESPEIAAARDQVERSRSRLMATAHRLQDRLSPKTLARGAWEGTKEKGADLAENAVDAVRARPLAATGVVSLLIDLAFQFGTTGRSRRRGHHVPGA